MSNNRVKDLIEKYRFWFIERKIRNKKQQKNGEYSCKPRATAIIQFFNKRRNIDKIIPAVSRIFDETIVIDDGSVDGSWKLLSKRLTGQNEFYIRSNDLYEVVMYDRAIRFSRGEIVCLLQDDDIPPDNDVWVNNALLLFDKYPDLCILGGRNGVDILPRDMSGSPTAADANDEVKTVRFSGVNHYHLYRKPIYRDNDIGIPFMFSVAVNRAPMFIRKDAFLALGGIDQSFRPFQCDDVDLCLRAWQGGGVVGLYDAPFRRDIGRGGMRLYNVGTMGAQAQKNWALIYQRHASSINDRTISDKVHELNVRCFTAMK